MPDVMFIVLEDDFDLLAIVLEGDLGFLAIVLEGDLDLNSCFFYYWQTDERGNNDLN